MTLAETDQPQAEESEAKRRSRVDKGVPKRAAQLVEAFLALDVEAITAAADELARRQLEAEEGLTNVKSIAMWGPPPVLLTRKAVTAAADELSKSRSIPWADGRTPAEVRRDAQAAAAESLPNRAKVAAEQRAREAAAAATRAAEAEAARQADIAKRKAAAGLPGWTGAVPK